MKLLALAALALTGCAALGCSLVSGDGPTPYRRERAPNVAQAIARELAACLFVAQSGPVGAELRCDCAARRACELARLPSGCAWDEWQLATQSSYPLIVGKCPQTQPVDLGTTQSFSTDFPPARAPRAPGAVLSRSELTTASHLVQCHAPGEGFREGRQPKFRRAAKRSPHSDSGVFPGPSTLGN